MPAVSVPFAGRLDLMRTTRALGMKAMGGPIASTVEAWWATRTPDGPASVRLRIDGSAVVARAWGDGARWVLERVPDLVGISDRPEDFDPAPGLVRDLHRRNQGLRLGRTWRVFDAVLPAILGQKVTNREARTAGARLVARFGDPAPGPASLRLPPDPARLATLSYADLHPLAIERKRAVTIIEAARRAHRLEEIMTMDREEAYRRILAIRGVGPWTAGHVMGIAWGDRDAVPIGDFHLPNTVAFALAGEPRGTDERMLELLEPYRGNRRRVVLLLKDAGIKAPKFGPRTAIRSIEHI